MTLIDTSAWIEFLRRDGDPRIKLAVAEHVEMGTAAYSCPVLFELLLGASPKEAAVIEELFAVCLHFVFTKDQWRSAATLGQRLRRAGLKVPAGDLQVAVVAMETGWPLLARDRHFPMMHAAVGDIFRLEVLV